MSTKTPEQAAEEWGDSPSNFHPNDFGESSGYVWEVVKKAFLAGREHYGGRMSEEIREEHFVGCPFCSQYPSVFYEVPGVWNEFHCGNCNMSMHRWDSESEAEFFARWNNRPVPFQPEPDKEEG